MKSSTRVRAFTLIEISVAVGILLIIVTISASSWMRYRSRTAVNRSAEVVRAIFERAVEEAKSTGYPLDESLLTEGLSAASQAQTSPEATILIQIRKRTRQSTSPAVISRRELPSSNLITVEFEHLGELDLDDAATDGVFLEIVQSLNNSETILATVPIDTNGDLILASNATKAFINFTTDKHHQTLEITHRGVISTR